MSQSSLLALPPSPRVFPYPLMLYSMRWRCTESFFFFWLVFFGVFLPKFRGKERKLSRCLSFWLLDPCCQGRLLYILAHHFKKLITPPSTQTLLSFEIRLTITETKVCLQSKALVFFFFFKDSLVAICNAGPFSISVSYLLSGTVLQYVHVTWK